MPPKRRGPIPGRAEWIEWQTSRNLHGSARVGVHLRQLLDGRFNKLKAHIRTRQVAEARQWIEDRDRLAALAAAALAAGVQQGNASDDDDEQDDAPGGGDQDESEEGSQEIQQGQRGSGEQQPGEDGTPEPPDDPLDPDTSELREQERAAAEQRAREEREASEGQESASSGRPKGDSGVTVAVGPLMTNAHLKGMRKYMKQNPPRFVGEWEGGWDKGQPVGEGGMGVVYLFRRMKSNEIIDRVVVKDSHVTHGMWTTFSFWYGDIRDSTDRLPMEIKAMEVIRDRPGREKCAEIRSRTVDDARRFYRIYMRYCPYGSLHDVIDTKYHADEPIPEPAIWSIFNDLVDACLLLQYGGIEEDDAVHGWEPMVHRDMKLNNVLLDIENKDREFSSYPRAKLADFGVTIMTDTDDDMNPNGYNDGMGTPNWRAPEQMTFLERKTLFPDTGKAWQLGEKTNVWGVGAIIVRLMNREQSPDGPHYKKYEPETPYLNEAGRSFSKEIRDLTLLCVSFDPADRPALREIRDRIRELTTPGGVADLAEGMRFEEHDAGDPNLRLMHKPDRDEYKYKLAAAGVR